MTYMEALRLLAVLALLVALLLVGSVGFDWLRYQRGRQ